MAKTIFQKILAGDIACHRVHEDAHTLAFLDISPLAAGHVLLIPKEPAETLDVLSDEVAAALGRVLPRLCRAVMAASGAKGYNVLQNNRSEAHQAVMHVHFHIIPKPSAAAGLRFDWTPAPTSEAKQMAMAEGMRAALRASA